MNSISLLVLTSISQLTLFAGIALILFGFIEKRENLLLGGQVIFLLLGFFAVYVLLKNVIVVPELDQNTVPKELKILTFYKEIVLFTGLTLISLILKLFKLRFQKTSLYILVFFALMLFFIVFGIQQTPN